MTHYSIIFYQTTYGDRVNVGLVMTDGENTIARSSKRKIKIVKKFKKTLHLFKWVIKSYMISFNSKIITVGDLTDLHRNNNGAVGVTKPTQILLDLNEENFNSLFNKIVNPCKN